MLRLLGRSSRLSRLIYHRDSMGMNIKNIVNHLRYFSSEMLPPLEPELNENDNENESAINETDIELDIFATSTAEDIVAHCRTRHLEFVIEILRQVHKKPDRRNRIVTQRTKKWNNQYNWLKHWLRGFVNGHLDRISRDIDDSMVHNKLMSALTKCHYNRKVVPLLTQQQQQSNNNYDNNNCYNIQDIDDNENKDFHQYDRELHDTNIHNINLLCNDISNELTQMSRLKLAAVIRKYSRKGGAAVGASHDKAFRDGKFRTDLQLHLGILT